MKNFRTRKIIVAIVIALASVLLAVTMLITKQGNFIFKNKNKINNLASNVSIIKTQKFDLTNVEVIKKASELLGKQYKFGLKGYNGNIYSNTYNSSKLYEAKDIGNTNDNPTNNDGIDCSGLVYWTLSSLAKEKGWSTPITTGFSYNNPVPVDCMHWLTYGKSANAARYWGEIEKGNKLIDTVNPTFNGKLINVLKKNDKAVSEGNSSGLTYYQYKDDNGNVKNLPSGTIIVSYNKGGSSKDYDHAWIYIGNLGTSNVNEAKAILEGMGITGLEVGRTIKQNGNSTHWRIEAAGGAGVYINNAVLPSGASENGKTIGNIWAFQVASEVSGKYEIEILKEDSKGKPITSGYEFKIKDINNKELGTNKYGANISKTDSITLKIEESKVPQGYTKVNNFEVKIGFKYSVEKSSYILDSNNIKLNNNNENIKINVNGNKITIRVPNKTRDLALKKIITHINNEQVDSQKIRHIKEFTTDLNNGKNNALYEMNKTPINVKVGDIVTYELKIYNEGETDGFASKIRDYIPVGLKLVDISYPKANKQLVNGTDYKYNETNNYVDITIRNLKTIKAYNKQTLSSDTIIVNCKVVEGATGILTNIAEITEYTFNNEKVNIDIDSKADNWIAPAKSAQQQPQEPTTADKSAYTWKNYANAKQNYLDNKFHTEFTAQEHSVNSLQGDDDDFEKLLVLTDYNFTIKKVNSNKEPLQGIDFGIIRHIDEEDFLNNTTNENGIIADNEEKNINTNENKTVIYKISEIPNNKINNIVQLDEDITISLVFVKGKLHEYVFTYGTKKETAASETKTYKCQTKNGITLDVTVEFNKENNDVKVIIENKYLVDGNYAIRMKKTSTQTDKALQGVIFSGTKTEYKQVGNSYEKVGQDTEIIFNATDANGLTNIIQSAINTNNYSYKDVYVINEISLGNNTTYTKMEKDITLSIYKKRDNLNYVLDYYEVACGDYIYSSKDIYKQPKILVEENGISFNITVAKTTIDNVPVIDIAITNAPDEIVKLWINKVSYEDNLVIAGTKYNVYVNDNLIFKYRDLDGCLELKQNIEPGNSAMQIKIEETKAAEGYENVLENKYILLNVEITQSVPTFVSANVYNEDDTINTQLNEYISASIVDMEDGSGKRIDVTIKNPKDEKVVDLALKKVITEINGVKLDENSNLESKYNRVETSKATIDVSPLQNGKEDAIYNLNKTPILLPVGAKVKYQLRVYNESSEIDATASKIKDYIPQGLKVLNVYYRDEQTPLNDGSEYTFDKTNNVLNISVLDKKALLDKFVSLGGTLDSDYITVECQIEENATGILTNVAEITEYKTENGFITEDRDSKSSNWENPNDGNSKNNTITDKNTYNWSNYTGNEENEYEESVYKNYLGQEDDDDFEKVIVANVDLVLKKVITKINDTDVNSLDAKYHRLENGKINVNYNQLDNNNEITTAEYYMNKTPINVKINDEVTYELRIYNEGNIDATASKITDYIPKGMDLVSVYKNNTKLTQGVDYTIDENNVLTITALKGQLIEKHLKGQDIYYNNIKVTCKVNGQVRGLLSNVAEITQYETKYGEINVDIDSQINNWEAEEGSNKLTLEGKAGSTWARYKFADIITGKFKDYKGQQDDDDFEKVRVLGGYSVNIKKVSARDNSAGLENVELDVNGAKYTTDENGECNLGQFEIDTQNSLSVITINEIVAQNDKYVKLKNPITIGIMSKESDDGSIQVYGYRINCVEPNLERASEVFISKALDKYGNIVALPQYLSKDTNIYTDVVNFYAEDENGNNVRIMLNVAPDKDNDSNVIFNIQIENDIKDNFYELFIKKVDEKGIAIDGVKFKVSGTFNKEIETKDGETNVVHIPINSKNYEIKDVYRIEEISTLYNYLDLKHALYLSVNKGINDANDSYELKSISLVCNGVETAEDTEVEIKNIKVDGNKTVDITAKIKENKVIVTIPNISKEFDLSLRKFITKINGVGLENSRIPVVNTSKLKENSKITTAEYSKVLDPVLVQNSDIVTYTIRVYNEGELDGYVTRIMDDVPEGLQMVAPAVSEDGTENLNAKYKWKMYRKFNEVIDDNQNTQVSIGIYNNIKYIETDKVEEAEFIVSDYLSMNNGTVDAQTGENSNLIKAFDVKEDVTLDYKDIQVEFKVIEPSSSERIIINKAQITDDKDAKGNPVTDRDSTPNVWEESPRDDDQDIENIQVFEEVKDNYYELYIKKVDEKGNALDGTKFNISGNGISDNLGKSNIEVETKGGNALVVNSLINSNNYQVKDVYTIEEIATLEDYFELKEKLQLSVSKGINVENNCYEMKSISLKCNNVETKEGTEVELKDVKVYKDKVVNIKAKIEGNKIIVTVPNIRKVFDLALYKWVSSTMVIEDNKVTEYASEHTQDDKSKLVNVTIPEKELDKTVVKFKYVIKVENQGNVDGYAKEIKDHIPEGLKFVAADNKDYGWVEKEDGVIVTDYLKDTLLEKGETAKVEVVLTWVNSKDNLGMKWNYAEISKDYNEFGTPDVDSRPDNFNGEVVEDDEDKDVVMLNVRTGSVMLVYIGLGLLVVAILAVGVVGVKKVLNRV